MQFIASSDLTKTDILKIFKRAQYFKNNTHKKHSLLKDKTIGLLFFEDSTRTRVSFEMAAIKLGAKIVFVSPKGSSISKGESELDTARVLECNGVDAMVVRTSNEMIPSMIAKTTKLPVLNAGEGTIDHPSQGLLDAFTLYEEFKGKLNGKTIAIVGDVKHSRVAQSNATILSKLGMDVRFVGPAQFLPTRKPEGVTSMHKKCDDGIDGVDALMCLRIQKERLDADEKLPNLDRYFKDFGLDHKRLELAKKGAKIMHPMPMNREVEVTSKLADDPKKSLIFEQMKNGLFVRMAMYEQLMKKPHKTSAKKTAKKGKK